MDEFDKFHKNFSDLLNENEATINLFSSSTNVKNTTNID